MTKTAGEARQVIRQEAVDGYRDIPGGVIAVTDPDDARLDPYRAVRERDLVGREGRFVAEGEVVLATLLSARSRFDVESILLLGKHLVRFAPAIAASAAKPPVYVAERTVLDRIAGFPIHRGILAIGRVGRPADPLTMLRALGGDALVVVLAGLTNHDNVGAAFRSAAAFGADLVLLDETCCDPLYRKAIRVSVGASLTVPFARGGSVAALVESLTTNGFEVTALSPGGDTPIDEVAWRGRSALLLGAEGPGLPREILARLATARIDMVPGFDSLNVATAAGIALHAASRGRAGRRGRADRDRGD